MIYTLKHTVHSLRLTFSSIILNRNLLRVCLILSLLNTVQLYYIIILYNIFTL